MEEGDFILMDKDKSKSLSPALKVPFLPSPQWPLLSTQRVVLVLRKSVYTKTIEQHSDVSSPNSLLDVL